MKNAICLVMLFCAGAAFGGGLTVSDAWVRAVPGPVTDTAAFMRVKNDGDAAVKLVGGKSPIAEVGMLMVTTRKTVAGADVLGMQGVDALEIPAHQERILHPGGDHLMLMNLRKHPKVGEKVKVTLQLEPGHRQVTVEADVKVN